MAEKDFTRNFKILLNEPLFKNEEYTQNLDAFNHNAYAETLYELLKSNDPPLSIGLFGSWGIGKSTIIHALNRKLKNERSDIQFIYFNAWKYSGDSFRREFLLSVAEQLNADERTLKWLKNLYYSSTIADEDTDDKFVRQMIKIITSKQIKPNPQRLLNATISFIFLSIASWIYWNITHDAKIFSIPAFAAIFIYFAQKQFPNVFEFKKTDIINPQLIFPEQFEDEFNSLISKSSKRLLIIIDDFDRCHEDMVYDILTTIKTFFNTKRSLVNRCVKSIQAAILSNVF